jgi:hypothetical protein
LFMQVGHFNSSSFCLYISRFLLLQFVVCSVWRTGIF